MKSYEQHVTTTLYRGLILFLALLFMGIQTAQGQQKTVTHATPVVQKTQDIDSDDDGLLQIEGSVQDYTDSSVRLSLRVTSTGDDKVTRKKPGRTKSYNVTLEKTTTAQTTQAQNYPRIKLLYSTPDAHEGGWRSSDMSSSGTTAAPAQDYNSSRSNNSSRSSTNTTAAPANNHNTTRSAFPPTRSHVSDGALEHTDDWIAARAAATGDTSRADQAARKTTDPNKCYVTATDQLGTRAAASGEPHDCWIILLAVDHGESDPHIPTDVHSGKLTGVRQHSPVKTSKPVDAATPYIYKALVDGNGSFAFEGVTPGAYRAYVMPETRIDDTGTEVEYYTIMLERVKVSA